MTITALSRAPSRSFFFFYCHGDHRGLHSFPTRRSSDLDHADAGGGDRVPAQGRAAGEALGLFAGAEQRDRDRKSTRLNSSHPSISYAVFCLKKKKTLT